MTAVAEMEPTTKKGSAPAAGGAETLTVKAPNFQILEVKIAGTSPYMQHAFPQKVREMLKAKHEAGSTAAKKKNKEARDFAADCEGAKHYSTDGWIGIPAPAFRNALISACRVVGFAMTRAKLSLFCEADGFDKADGTGLVRIHGEPEETVLPVRNETGVVDLRARPMWREWSATLRIRYDADQFTATDVLNLILRAGQQVGIGEGRPDSKKSAGLGYGMFTVVQGG